MEIQLPTEMQSITTIDKERYLGSGGGEDHI